MNITFTNELTGKTTEMKQMPQEDGSTLLSMGEQDAPCASKAFESLVAEERVEFWQNQAEGLSVTLGNVMKSHRELVRKVTKLKRLMLLTDDSVSSQEMNELTTKQWLEFIRCFPDEAR
jgi:hypothetical protein